MSSHFGCRSEHASAIECPKCGKTGTVIWGDISRPDGDEKELVRIDGEFYERIAKSPPHPIELVCNSCGTPQHSSLQS